MSPAQETDDALRTLLAALPGGVVLDRLNVPVGPLIGAMVGVAPMNLLGSQTASLPFLLRFGL